MYKLFIGDDTNGDFGRKFYFTPISDLDLTGCIGQFTIAGITKIFTDMVSGEPQELVFTRAQTAAMKRGVYRAILSIFDSTGRHRTIANDILVKCTDVVEEVYSGESNTVQFNIDCGVSWDGVSGKPRLVTKSELSDALDGIDLSNVATQGDVRRTLKTLIDALKNISACVAVLFCMSAFGYDDNSKWEDVIPTNTVKEVVEKFSPPVDFTKDNKELVKTIEETVPVITNAPWLTSKDANAIKNTIPVDAEATSDSIYLRNSSGEQLITIPSRFYNNAGLMTWDDKEAIDNLITYSGEVRDDIYSLNDRIDDTRQIVYKWDGFLGGSNVVFSITNYISGAYNLESAKFKIRELKNGVYHDVYNSRDEILLHVNSATGAVISAVEEKIAGKADKAWGKYSSDGQNLQDVSISNTVYMTAPNTVFAGGLEYERVAVGQGSVCVLTTKGAPVWTQGDEGTFKFQDDGGTNYFGFAKTDSYTIGADTDGISVNGGIVTMTYNITMSGRPCIWYKASLQDKSAPWEQLNLPDGSAVSGASHAVSWEQNPPVGSQACYINVGDAPSGFFKATVEVAGAAKFMTNMPADLFGGIICTNTATGISGVIKPTFDGSTVIWTWSAK